MRINGVWEESRSGVLLPTISVRVRAGDGSWQKSEFLIDTGADVSVIRYDLLYALELEPEPEDGTTLNGVGGGSSSVRVETILQFERDDGVAVNLHGIFHGITDPIALELSVLGRDVLGHFALIVDRPGKVVVLVAGQHAYQIIATT